jgi:hypothetical protein
MRIARDLFFRYGKRVPRTIVRPLDLKALCSVPPFYGDDNFFPIKCCTTLALPATTSSLGHNRKLPMR